MYTSTVESSAPMPPVLPPPSNLFQISILQPGPHRKAVMQGKGILHTCTAHNRPTKKDQHQPGPHPCPLSTHTTGCADGQTLENMHAGYPKPATHMAAMRRLLSVQAKMRTEHAGKDHARDVEHSRQSMRGTDLVPVKVIPHHTQPPCPQQVSLHQLLAGLHIAAQPHTHQGQVLAHGEEVTTLQEARLLDVAGNRQPCTPAAPHGSHSDTRDTAEQAPDGVWCCKRAQ